MIKDTYITGGDPLPIFTTECSLRAKVVGQLLDRWDLVFVDVRWKWGVIAPDVNGYFPHLAYRPRYALTEGDRGEWDLTGNRPKCPVFRFDPGPFFANIAGTVELTGGAPGGELDVTVVIKRYTKQRELPHTLTIGTTTGRFARPFGAYGLQLACQTNNTTMTIGGTTPKNVTQPNGGMIALGCFDTIQFTNNRVATFSLIPPW